MVWSYDLRAAFPQGSRPLDCLFLGQVGAPACGSVRRRYVWLQQIKGTRMAAAQLGGSGMAAAHAGSKWCVPCRQ